jgi:hypothetical protein
MCVAISPPHSKEEFAMRSSINRAIPLAVVVLVLISTRTASAQRPPTRAARADSTSTLALKEVPGAFLHYGDPVTLGEGMVRTYLVLDEKIPSKPIEVGVIVDARTMEGKLPNEMLMIPLTLPENKPRPYHFVLFDWNPEGHLPEGVYDVPHFDFHFYLTPHVEVEAITPDDPQFRVKANNLPEGDFVPKHYTLLTPPGLEPADITEPRMGLHWEDMRDTQIQGLLGKSHLYQPFTKPIIYASWDGQITFIEPMITREYLLRRTNETIPIPQPARYPQPGWYPAAYRITYDAQAREYRVAIVDFAWRE